VAAIAIEDDGYIDVELAGITARLDLYGAYDRVSTIIREMEDKPAADYFVALHAYLTELGFPPVSNRAADKFASAISDAVTALKNADGATQTPALREPTAQQPSNSPPETGSRSS